MNELAIIIPAYKSTYLNRMLESLCNQTDKRFHIYIGDDSSPQDLESIIQKYTNKLPITYKKFKNNLGAISLTSQWERCIELSQEKWIWLLSDDDEIENNCVEVFYSRKDKSSKFLKFKTKIIDSNGNILTINDNHDTFIDEITSEQFINWRLDCSGFCSFAIEYIFSRDLYNSLKFKDLPLAWASDDATWFMYSIENNMRITCLDAYVKWRQSSENISSLTTNDNVNLNKIKASIEYVKWLQTYSISKNIFIKKNKFIKWISIQIALLKFKISFNHFIKILEYAGIRTKKYSFYVFKYYLIIKYYHLKSLFVNVF